MCYCHDSNVGCRARARFSVSACQTTTLARTTLDTAWASIRWRWFRADRCALMRRSRASALPGIQAPMIDGHGRLSTGSDGTLDGHQMSTSDQHDMTPSAARSVTMRIGVGLG